MGTKNWIALSAVSAFVWLAWNVSTAPLDFRSLAQARTEMENAGYYCISDLHDGSVNVGGFMVSQDRLTWEFVNTICKVGKMRPEWKRMAWVTLRNGHLGDLQGFPDGADVRSWGNVYIVGESGFIDELECALRSKTARRN